MPMHPSSIILHRFLRHSPIATHQLPLTCMGRWRLWVTRCSWLYAGVVLIALIAVRLGADRWWPATLLMFGPRWLFVYPMVLFIPIAIVLSRRALWPLGISLAVILGPLMGLCLPWRLLISPTPTQQTIRVLSC